MKKLVGILHGLLWIILVKPLEYFKGMGPMKIAHGSQEKKTLLLIYDIILLSM
jgi:hypothetical protein